MSSIDKTDWSAKVTADTSWTTGPIHEVGNGSHAEKLARRKDERLQIHARKKAQGNPLLDKAVRDNKVNQMYEAMMAKRAQKQSPSTSSPAPADI